MQIKKINVLKGANIWSSRRKQLIQMLLDLEQLEEFPTNKIEGFYDRLTAFLPSMHSHRCSEGVPGGFFSRVKEGTWMGHVIEHIALEIQTLAGMETGFGRTRETADRGVYHVVFSYIEEEAGHYAAKAAMEIAQALIKGEAYDLEKDLSWMRNLYRDNRLGPSTQNIVDAATEKGIPWFRLNNRSLIQFGYGIHQQLIEATVTGNTGYIAVETVCDKQKTKELLERFSVKVPQGAACKTFEEVEAVQKELGFPLVIKPLNGHQGKGASVNLTTPEQLKSAYRHAKQYGSTVITECFINGDDYRILVINHKVVAAAKRSPPAVTGDGVQSVKELIEEVNRDPRRGEGHENILTKIAIDEETRQSLAKVGMQLDSVPENGKVLWLKTTANLSTGGTATDVTDQLHSEVIFVAERISKLMRMDICGIDLIAANIRHPLSETGGAVLEVNAAPGFRMHLYPSVGPKRNVGAAVMNMLYPPGKPFAIPIIAVTGTNGKTTTSRLTAFIASEAGFKVGLTTSDGIYIHGRMIERGDTTGPWSARHVLQDPTVDFAVLETARGGILREGLGYTACDIGIITNITEDHLGIDNINTLNDLVRVKSVVAESVKAGGWAILNADDPYCMKVRERLTCNIAYFAMNETSEQVRRLSKEGAFVAVCENGYLTIKQGEWKTRILSVKEVPLTIGGTVGFMILNVLAAVLAAYLQGIDAETIKKALKKFTPDSEHTPGRINIFEFNKFKVMIDFAHNPAGYTAIKEFLATVSARRKIGIIAGVGDRRDQDIKACGALAAEMFDHIIIRQERHLRGRTANEISDLLTQGIKEVKPDLSYEIIPQETEAIQHALLMAKDNDFIVALSDVVSNAIEIVEKYRRNELLTSETKNSQ